MPSNKDTPEAIFEDSLQASRRLLQESDVGCALIGTAFLDDCLEALLRASFLNDPQVMERLLGVDRPLGTFSSRIDVAYCLGLITPDERKELHLMRNIRNHFAHQRRKTTFSEAPVSDLCRNLQGVSHKCPKASFVAVAVVQSALLLLRAVEARRHNFQENYPVPIGEEALSKLMKAIEHD